MQKSHSFPLSSMSLLFLMILVGLLNACGSDSKNKIPASTSSSSVSNNFSTSSSSSSMTTERVLLSGTVTYDFVPHKNNSSGLNYLATEQRAVRGAVIEILSENGVILDSSVTAADGSYLFNVSVNTFIKVRVKAELFQSASLSQNTSPSWHFKVTDNTNNNALYVLVGSLVSTGASNSSRDLHAASGWGGSNYSSVRAAAPFAILDNIYIGISRLNQAGNTRDFKPLELRWSTKNNEAEGNYELGEIGTSFFDPEGEGSIYILGDANNDTDEFDSHVILHEWGHYLEENFSRSDSMGGEHSDGKALDMRLAMSEGFANAFSAMILNNPIYADSQGSAQNSGLIFNISNKTRDVKGYFSEGSVASILYNYYNSSNNKISNDIAPIFSVVSSNSYTAHEAMNSVFLFYGQLKTVFSDQAAEFNSLMLEQNINGTDEYGTNEINTGGLAVSLPVYKTISPDNVDINVCSSPEFGKFNKLANSQFLKLTISQSGLYNIYATKAGGADAISKPEIIIYRKGNKILTIENTLNNTASGNVNLANGIYIIEIYDLSNNNPMNAEWNTLCFDVRVDG